MKILIVDSSALSRRALSEIIKSIPNVEFRTAKNGREGVSLTLSWMPDVVILEIHMPVIGGVSYLRRIMSQSPLPVVVMVPPSQRDSREVMDALALGAVAVIEKPERFLGKDMGILAKEVQSVVAQASQARPGNAIGGLSTREGNYAWSNRLPSIDKPLVIIGVSTGGPGALDHIIPLLPAGMSGTVVIVQHMPEVFTKSFAERLNANSAISVVEAYGSCRLEEGHAYVIRGGTDGVIGERLGRLHLVTKQVDHNYSWHPSVDRLMYSALSMVSPAQIIGVLLTGMGSDGAQSFCELHGRGGYTIAESETSCVVFGMPRELIALGGADIVLNVSQIAPHICRIMK